MEEEMDLIGQEMEAVEAAALVEQEYPQIHQEREGQAVLEKHQPYLVQVFVMLEEVVVPLMDHMQLDQQLVVGVMGVNMEQQFQGFQE
jgi:hypothetical protein